MKRFAPAKINLSLEILGSRPDGFHNLRSLFLPVSLCDTLTFEPAAAFSFTCTEPGVPVDETNLVVRAAKSFGRGTLPNFSIHLEKHIPHSAGLGGGSSDAATTLLALNEVSSAPLAFRELEEIAATLGSDVPFFLHRSAAWCEGRGEIVRPTSITENFYILLFKPPFGVPTPWAYQHLANSRSLPGIPMEEQQTDFCTLTNDLERPVFEKYLLLALMKQFLLAQPETVGALMSGSGSTMFAITRDATEAETLRERMLVEFGPNHWTAIVAPYHP